MDRPDLASLRSSSMRPELVEGRLADFDRLESAFSRGCADFEIGKAGGAQRVGQPLGIPDHDEGQLVRMDDRAVRLGGCFRSHRTQQRQAAVDVVVREVRREPG